MIAYKSLWGTQEYQGQQYTQELQTIMKKEIIDFFGYCPFVIPEEKKDSIQYYYVVKGIKIDTTTQKRDTIYVRFPKFNITVYDKDYTTTDTKERDLTLTIYKPQKFKENKWVKLHSWWEKNNDDIQISMIASDDRKQSHKTNSTTSANTKTDNAEVFNLVLPLRFLPNDYIYLDKENYTCGEIPKTINKPYEKN